MFGRVEVIAAGDDPERVARFLIRCVFSMFAEDVRLLPDASFRRLLDAGVADGWVSSCGSGVTACHTLLLAEHLGLPQGRLYAGSWSQWAATDRPAALGPEP